MSVTRAISDLGDLAVAGPSAAIVGGWLWVYVSRSTALTFAAGFTGLVTVVTALKVFARALAPDYSPMHLWRLSPGAPSGHAALAGLVYGVAVLVFVRLGRGAARLIGVGLGGGAILVVSVTRVTLRDHTIGDVLAGLAIAGAVVAAFDRLLMRQGRTGRPSTEWLAGALIMAPLLILASGLRLPSTLFL